MRNAINKMLLGVYSVLLAPLSLFSVQKNVKFYNSRIDSNVVNIFIDDESRKSGILGIDRIYYINLNTRPEREKRMKALMQIHRFYATRVEAVNGKALLKKDIFLIRGEKKYDPNLTLGAIGCALSHFSIWKDALIRNYDRIWIMEDDIETVEPLQMIPELLEKLTTLDTDWDILYTDPDTRDWDGKFLRQTHTPPMNHPKVIKRDPSYFFNREPVGDDFERIYARMGSYSLIISKSGIEKLINFHKSMELWTSTDVSIHLVPDIHQYVLVKPYVTHTITNRTSDTDS